MELLEECVEIVKCAHMGASAMVHEGITNPTTLEAYACREALELASDLNA
jgi:hypothetical protein